MSLYQHSIEHCLEDKLGKSGLSSATLSSLLDQLAKPFEDIKSGKNPSVAALLRLPSTTDDLATIEETATFCRRFKHVVVAGAGGSGLSGRTLLALKGETNPRFHFLENVDPDLMENLLAHLPIDDSCFLIISKSGTTAETLSQFYVLWESAAKALGKQKAAERFIAITMNQPSPLFRAAQTHGFKQLEYAPDIGGRFSALTNVGLLPAAIAGIDIRALRQGAQTVIENLKSAKKPADFAPAVGAALQCGFIKKGCALSVMFPYAERLSGFSAWYRQSWAESLGKKGFGSTPIRAVGTTDQHSQLQLYLDGPKDKLFHLVTVKRAQTGAAIAIDGDPEVAYLKGKTLGDVMEAEQRATFSTLINNGCPVRLIELPKLTEAELGALLMHFTLEIVLTASLQQVNPFDQPAVEESKKLARDYLLKGLM